MATTGLTTDVLVVGAGPGGSAAAAWAARHGLDVLLADAAQFPRDKACGDGLTPRAINELQRLGLHRWVGNRTINWGLRAHGFGQTLHLPWPGGRLPAHGSAVARTVLDDRVRGVALADGVREMAGARAIQALTGAGGRVAGVRFKIGSDTVDVRCRRLVVADGARSQLGRTLGRQWHRDTVYGVAARSYMDSERSDDPWISSHLELRGTQGEVLSGYGWIFPLGDGTVNLGVGTLATANRPADVNLRHLLRYYADQQRGDFDLVGQPQRSTSALLPMGGAVSNVAGPNWMLIGDAAGCVNPLNGEGIDYALETGRFAAELLAEGRGQPGAMVLSRAWPQVLRQHYGDAFSIARRLAGLLTVPGLLPVAGPVGMRSRSLMKVALRVMGNLVDEQDRDAVARLWRIAGRGSQALDARPPFL